MVGTRNPQTEAEIRAVLMMAFGMAAVIVRGPNSQALIAQLLTDIEDPVTWNALMNVLLGPAT